MKPYRVRCMDCRRVTGRCEVPHSTGICARCFNRRYGGERHSLSPGLWRILATYMVSLFCCALVAIWWLR